MWWGPRGVEGGWLGGGGWGGCGGWVGWEHTWAGVGVGGWGTDLHLARGDMLLLRWPPGGGRRFSSCSCGGGCWACTLLVCCRVERVGWDELPLLLFSLQFER